MYMDLIFLFYFLKAFMLLLQQPYYSRYLCMASQAKRMLLEQRLTNCQRALIRATSAFGLEEVTCIDVQCCY